MLPSAAYLERRQRNASFSVQSHCLACWPDNQSHVQVRRWIIGAIVNMQDRAIYIQLLAIYDAPPSVLQVGSWAGRGWGAADGVCCGGVSSSDDFAAPAYTI